MAVLSDEMRAQIEGALPPVKGAMGRPTITDCWSREQFTATGLVWRELPSSFGPWQAVWKRHHRFATDGTWDKVLSALQVQADARGEIDGRVSVDSTSSRVQQHGATASRSQGGPNSHTGDKVESQKIRQIASLNLTTTQSVAPAAS